MQLLSYFIETASASKTITTSSTLAALLFAAFGVFQSSKLTQRQYRKLKWQAAKEFLKSKFSRKREKGEGSGLFLIILLLIAGVAVLWILWELGGIFALILGIVGALALISLILRTK